MKIGFYTDTYLPNTDGVVSQILTSKKELEKRKHYVHVFAPGTKEDKKANHDKTVTYYEGVKFPLYPNYKLAIFPYSSAFDVKQLKLELIHSHAIATMGLASIFTAKTLHLPLVGTFHTMVPLAAHYLTKDKKAQKILTSAAWKTIELFYKPFDAVTAPSRVIANLLEKNGVENVKVISNGIDTTIFKPQNGTKIRRELKLGKEKTFLFVGRITKEKGVDVVMKAFSKLNEPAKLVIVGDGPHLNEVKKLHKKLKLGDNVMLTGQVPFKQMPQYYAACDWQITASMFETQGLGILEGMACGKPCIGADYLAIPETVKHNQNGWLFQAGNVTECLNQMQNALQHTSDKKYKTMSANALHTAKTHSIQKTTDQWEKLYASLL